MGKYSNKATKDDRHEASLVSAITKLHLTQGSNHKIRHGPPLPRRPMSHKTELLQGVLLGAMADEMEVDGERQSQDPLALVQITELLQATMSSLDCAMTGDPFDGNVLSSIGNARDAMKECHALMRTCGLSGDMHLSFLKHWQNVTSLVISSPVFSTPQFWSHHVLVWSMKRPTLHCALLAVAGLQWVHMYMPQSPERKYIQAAYRLHAEAERRLKYSELTQDENAIVATHVCLLFFDYLSGNQEAWENRLFLTKWAMKQAGLTNIHRIGRYFFYSVARQDCLASYTDMHQSFEPGRFLAWDGLLEATQYDEVVFDNVDQIGALYAELIRLQSCLLNLGTKKTDSDLEVSSARQIELDNINDHLSRWKESFPLNLQTYGYEGDVRDKSCFLHALTCNGGSRAVALHCLFAELMLQLLDIEHDSISEGLETAETRQQLRDISTQSHQHAMTICRLVQSMTSSAALLDYDMSSNMSAVLGCLHKAGENLFSKDGKAWLERLLMWTGTVTGNAYADALGAKMKLRLDNE